MNHRLGSVYLSAVLLALAPAAVLAGAAPIQLQDFRQLVHITSPQFSPDGSQIA